MQNTANNYKYDSKPSKEIVENTSFQLNFPQTHAQYEPK